MLRTDLGGGQDTRSICDGEVTGVEFQLPANYRICVMYQNSSQMLRNFLLNSNTGIKQHKECALLRLLDDGNIVVFDVRMITIPSQELDPVFALNLLNGTVFYLTEGICHNATFDNRNHSIQFLLEDGMFELV